MVRDTRAYLWDARHGCARIARFLLGVNLDAYAANDLVRSAVEQPFEIIGEALAPVARRDLRRQHPKDRGWYFDVADWIEADGFSLRASGPCLPRTRARVRRAQQEPIHGV